MRAMDVVDEMKTDREECKRNTFCPNKLKQLTLSKDMLTGVRTTRVFAPVSVCIVLALYLMPEGRRHLTCIAGGRVLVDLGTPGEK
jgi:hypothetical protein